MALVTPTNQDILTGLGDLPGADMTARLLLALTALYVQRATHTVEEQRQYVELALRLVEKVDAATRTAVANILKRHADAPADVVARLGATQPWFKGAPEGELLSAHDQYPAADQHSADGNDPSISAPSGTAPVMLTSATPEFGEAFFAASPAERRRLLSLIPPGDSDDVHTASVSGERIYGGLDIAALNGRVGEFICEFERLVNIPKGLCERILNDPSGEPMVVAAKAAGMPVAMLQRMLLLVTPAVSHSVQRVYELSELYLGLDRVAARALLAMWRAHAKPNDPTPETRASGEVRRPDALRNTSVASLRSRFGALTQRLQSQPVNARLGPGSVVRRDLRSR